MISIDSEKDGPSLDSMTGSISIDSEKDGPSLDSMTGSIRLYEGDTVIAHNWL